MKGFSSIRDNHHRGNVANFLRERSVKAVSLQLSQHTSPSMPTML